MKSQILAIFFILSLVTVIGTVLFSGKSSEDVKIDTSNAITVSTRLLDANEVVVLIKKNDTEFYSDHEVNRIVHETAAKYTSTQGNDFADDLFDQLKFLVDKRGHIHIWDRYVTITIGAADE